MGSVWKDTHGGMGFCAEGECRRVSWLHFSPSFKLQSFLSIYYLLNILLSNKDKMVNETGQKNPCPHGTHTHAQENRKEGESEGEGEGKGWSGCVSWPSRRNWSGTLVETPGHLSASLKSRRQDVVWSYGRHCPAAPASPGLSFHGLRALGPPAKTS